MYHDDGISSSINAIYDRMSRLERLIVKLMPDEAIARTLDDGDFLAMVLEEKCDSGAFHIRTDREVPGGFIIMRAVEKVPVGRESAKLLPLPASVQEYVERLISLGAKLRIDHDN